MFELIGAGLLGVGALMTLAGFIWLIRLAWKSRRSIGVLTFLTIPVGGPLIYGLAKFRTSRTPLILVLLGLVIGAVPFWYDKLYIAVVGFGERDRMIDGERHLTLTGWDRRNYDLLTVCPDVVVLEIANSDVTDQTLELLLPMTGLKELTVNDSAVSDAGFATLRKLPALNSLRMARTKITKEGVADFLADPPPNLQNIDVTGNNIPASALRKWKNADSQHRKYLQ